MVKVKGLKLTGVLRETLANIQEAIEGYLEAFLKTWANLGETTSWPFSDFLGILWDSKALLKPATLLRWETTVLQG